MSRYLCQICQIYKYDDSGPQAYIRLLLKLSPIFDKHCSSKTFLKKIFSDYDMGNVIFITGQCGETELHTALFDDSQKE